MNRSDDDDDEGGGGGEGVEWTTDDVERHDKQMDAELLCNLLGYFKKDLAISQQDPTPEMLLSYAENRYDPGLQSFGVDELLRLARSHYSLAQEDEWVQFADAFGSRHKRGDQFDMVLMMNTIVCLKKTIHAKLNDVIPLLESESPEYHWNHAFMLLQSTREDGFDKFWATDKKYVADFRLAMHLFVNDVLEFGSEVYVNETHRSPPFVYIVYQTSARFGEKHQLIFSMLLVHFVRMCMKIDDNQYHTKHGSNKQAKLREYGWDPERFNYSGMLPWYFYSTGIDAKQLTYMPDEWKIERRPIESFYPKEFPIVLSLPFVERYRQATARLLNKNLPDPPGQSEQSDML